MADRGTTGMPLLSGPAPPHDSSRADISCRKCNKEFNIVFTRARKCNHCGMPHCLMYSPSCHLIFSQAILIVLRAQIIKLFFLGKVRVMTQSMFVHSALRT